MPADRAPRTKAQQRAETRAALLGAARPLFAEHGYGAVATEEIVRAANVTRGALYHQFADKKDLFRAVFEEIETELVAEIAELVTGETDPWQIALKGSYKFLDQCLDPAVQQIAIIDAPSVLGFVEQRAIVDRHGGALIEATLGALMEQGVVATQPVRPLARVLRGALVEGGVLIAEAQDKQTARREVGAAIERLLDGLRVAPV